MPQNIYYVIYTFSLCFAAQTSIFKLVYFLQMDDFSRFS